MIPPPPTSTLLPYTTLFRSPHPPSEHPPPPSGGEGWREGAFRGAGVKDLGDVRMVHQRQRLTLRLKDRKSTRLNSSHTVISYAVFCLKKKKKLLQYTPRHTR